MVLGTATACGGETTGARKDARGDTPALSEREAARERASHFDAENVPCSEFETAHFGDAATSLRHPLNILQRSVPRPPYWEECLALEDPQAEAGCYEAHSREDRALEQFELLVCIVQ